MLVRLTHRCQMQCTHCLTDATPNSEEHMTLDIFRTALDFMESLGLPILILSGGEPADHPEFLLFLEEIARKKVRYHTTLLSNGMFLSDPSLTDAILARVDAVQITNDDRFYPQEVPFIKHPKLMYEAHLRIISPFGRALTNHLEVTARFPGCLHLRTLLVQDLTLREAIYKIRQWGKFCTPSINVDGTLVLGETRYCCALGNVARLSTGLLDKTCSSDWKLFPGMKELVCVKRYQASE